MNKMEYTKEDIIEMQEDITWWQNRFNAVQRDYENLQQRIDNAIEEINYMITNADITEISAIKLKQILGDKENE